MKIYSGHTSRSFLKKQTEGMHRMLVPVVSIITFEQALARLGRKDIMALIGLLSGNFGSTFLMLLRIAYHRVGPRKDVHTTGHGFCLGS